MNEPRESHMKKTHGGFCLLGIITILLCFVSTLKAQEGRTFANPQNWQRVSTEHFEVYYFGENEAGAKKTAKFAELARFEIGVLYDYKPEETYALVYLPGSDAFLQTNLDWELPEKLPGIFNLPKRRAPLIDMGTSKELYQEVKYQVARQVFKEFAYGDRLGGAIQNQLLLYNPQWFHEGLAEYLSTEWTFKDEMWLNSVRNAEELLELALEGDEHLNRVVRKSIWHFIAHEYGKPKISEIIYLVNIAHSIESGLISVLGITLNSLTERWRDFVLSRKSLLQNGRSKIGEIPGLEEVKIKSGYELTSFALNDEQGVVALYLNKRGHHKLYMYDIASQSYTHTSVSSGVTSERAEFVDFYYPMAWNTDGDVLATTVYRNHRHELVYYNISKNTAEYFPLPKEIQSVHSLAWAHDGDRLAISGYGDGHSDIFVASAFNNNFTPITQDNFDDIYPSWSLDDDIIYFSSNRNEVLLEQDELDWSAYKRHFDVFAYDIDQNDRALIQITQTPSIDETQVGYWADSEIGFISDASGIRNLNVADVSSGKEVALTNFANGVLNVDIKDRSILASAVSREGKSLYLLDRENFTVERRPESSILRVEYDAEYQKRLNKELRKAEEEAKRENDREAQTKRPFAPSGQSETEEQVAQNDNAPAEQIEEQQTEEVEQQVDEPIRYYLFDEEDEPYEVKSPRQTVFRPQTSIQTQQLFNSVFGGQKSPELADISVSNPLRARTEWSADYFEFGLRFDPIARYGLDLGVGFSDMLGNHQVQLRINPFLRFRNRDAVLRYDYKKFRLDLFAEAGIHSRLYEQESGVSVLDTLNFQFDKYFFNVGAQYPIIDRFTVGAEVGYNRIERQDLKLVRAELFDQSDNIIKPGVFVRYSNVREREGFKFYGLSAQANFDSYYSTEIADFVFHTVRLDIKGYYTIFNKIVLAASVISGVSLADTIPERQTFYLGGIDNILRGFEFEESSENTVEFSNVSPDLYNFSFQRILTPSRGFDFFARNGSRYVLANLEFRIPISRLVKHSLNSNPLYSLEFIPFVDMGTVWDSGNPFSTRKPTDTQIIGTNPIIVQLQTLKSPFLFGFGSGLRTNLIGYSIRLDLSWGLDDNTLQAPIFSVSMGRNF